MIADILRLFPPHAHPLTLVSDPDHLLRDESMMAELADAGFRILDESDPVDLRCRVEQARPFSANRPLIVVTEHQVRDLPYDLWQQGHHVTLSLSDFFPNLVYPIVRALSSSQRWHLYQAPPPDRTLGRQATIDYILQQIFAVDLDRLREPARFVAWLNEYHRRADPMAPVFAERVLGFLTSVPAFREWPLNMLLSQQDAFASFVSEQWQAYLQQRTGQLLREEPARYVVDFEADRDLQDTLPRLVRSQVLEPVAVDHPDRLPSWTKPAVLGPDEDRRPRRVDELLTLLRDQMQARAADTRWAEWQAVARAWAELNALRDSATNLLNANQQQAYQALRDNVDVAFLDWLRGRYALLGGQRLPVPHHVHHVPHFIAYQRRQGYADRAALIVLDGMALADWQLIAPTWRARHPMWRLDEQLLLAQLPTITSVSRQALLSGRRPTDFAGTMDSNRAEPREWAAFWSIEGLPAQACAYASLRLDHTDTPPELQDSRIQALCLVSVDIDDIVHGATLGAADVQASLTLWLDTSSRRLETIIDDLLTRGFAIYLASDHGHVEALGMGQVSEGVIVQTRSQRARLYRDEHAALNARQLFAQTIIWGQDGLLPDDLWMLMPSARRAFTTRDEIVVTHGGPTLDEVVVPLVTIGQG